MLSFFDLLFASFASKVQLMLTYVWFKFVSRGKKRTKTIRQAPKRVQIARKTLADLLELR